MDENCPLRSALDESEALTRVNTTLQFSVPYSMQFLFQISYLMLLSPGPLRITGRLRCFSSPRVKRAENKKGRQVVACDPSKTKAKQEQQNADLEVPRIAGKSKGILGGGRCGLCVRFTRKTIGLPSALAGMYQVLKQLISRANSGECFPALMIESSSADSAGRDSNGIASPL